MSTPRGAEMLRRVIDSRLLDVHTTLPCEVKAFDAAAQTVDVQPLIKNVVVDEEYGDETIESYPQINAVPVIYQRSGAFVMAFPLEVGDVVTVVFNEWSIDNLVEKGTEDHPIDLQRHSFAGAVAFPGGPYSSSDPVGETIDALILANDGGAIIRIKDDGNISLSQTGIGVVHVGADSCTEQLMLGTKFRTQQAILSTALQTGFTAIGAGFTALGVGWTANGVGWTAIATFAAAVAGDATMAAHPVTVAAAGVLATAGGVAAAASTVAATACTTAATACSTAATAVSTFESAGAPDNYLSNKAKTIA